MNMTIGIDFTGSNYNPAAGVNLHNPIKEENHYFKAITEISKIVLAFDSDKSVPLFGFGAVLDNIQHPEVSH